MSSITLDLWRWVALALADADERMHFHYVHVTSDSIAASDGNRLHWLPNSYGMAEGAYDRLGRIMPGIDNAPRLGRAIPPLGEETLLSVRLDRKRRWKTRYMGDVIDYVMVGPSAFQERFMRDAFDQDDEATGLLANNNRALRLDFPDGRIAVVMSILVD